MPAWVKLSTIARSSGSSSHCGHVAAQHAALPLAGEVAEPVGGLLAALAGDDQHRPEAPGVGLEQEGAQARVGVALAQPVQIDARIDLDLARGDLPRLAAIEVGERRRRRLSSLAALRSA